MTSTRMIRLVTLVACLWGPGASAQDLAAPAEKADFQQRGTPYAPLMDFVDQLESRSDLIYLQTLTETLMERSVLLCILSDPPVYRGQEALASGKPIVLIVNNVHGGETAGKDASLILMRDLALGDLRPLLEQVIVLIVPTINPDGAERYRRTNEQRLDLNRDYIKLESKEVRALVARVIADWQPDVHVDTHNGGSPPYTLTYQTCLNPSCDSDLVALANDTILPGVREALQSENYDGFWYRGPSLLEGKPGWGPTSCEPRKHHTYSVLSNMIGLLFESPTGSHRIVDSGSRVVAVEARDRYRHQVRGQYLGLREVIRYAAKNGNHLRTMVRAARERTILLGLDDSDNDPVVIEYQQAEAASAEFWRIRGWDPADDPEAPDQEQEYEKVVLPLFTRFVTTRTATRPWGYLLPPDLGTVVPLLLEHGIAVKRLTHPLDAEVEIYYAHQISRQRYFQGHYLTSVRVAKETERANLPPGSFFVPTAQAKGNLVCYLLEPETDDNFVTWNFLDRYLNHADTPAESHSSTRKGKAPIPIYRLMKQTKISGVLLQNNQSSGPGRYPR